MHGDFTGDNYLQDLRIQELFKNDPTMLVTRTEYTISPLVSGPSIHQSGL